MAEDKTTLRADISNIIAWIGVLPALVFWPFLSIFPAIALWKGAGSSLAISVQVILLATGFWAVGGLLVIAYALLSEAAKERLSSLRGRGGILLGIYATVWTALYAIAAFAGR